MKVKLMLVVAAMSAAMFAPQGARAENLVFASGPGGGLGANYTVPAMVIRPGDTLTYANIDIAAHDVRSVNTGPDVAWCKTFPFNFRDGQCPLFSSKLIGLGQTSPVYGLENVKSGTNYAFYCTLHYWMRGTLVVTPKV